MVTPETIYTEGALEGYIFTFVHTGTYNNAYNNTNQRKSLQFESEAMKGVKWYTTIKAEKIFKKGKSTAVRIRVMLLHRRACQGAAVEVRRLLCRDNFLYSPSWGLQIELGLSCLSNKHFYPLSFHFCIFFTQCVALTGNLAVSASWVLRLQACTTIYSDFVSPFFLPSFFLFLWQDPL